MALYLGSDKIKINLKENKFKLNLYSSKIVNNSSLLKEANGLVLKDANGLYLTEKEDE